MSIVRCSVCNRYYDDNKYTTCPSCSKSFAFEMSNDVDREMKTLPLDFTDAPDNNSSHNENDIKTQAYYEDVTAEEKTIGLFFQEEDYNPVTAWIVCIKGTVKGKCYEVHMNRNFIGRDKLMDISIPDDLKISRENHLSITYDNKTNRFFAKDENGSLTIDGKIVSSAVEIVENSILEFGDSKYVFIPYCTDERNWNNND